VASIFEHPEGTSLGEMGVDRILTVPNAITGVRLLCVPLYLYLLIGRDSPGWAGFLLGALASTDWVDGYVARRFNQGSNFGKMFDPLTDRIMLVTAIGGFIYAEIPPFWYGVTILTREVLLSIWVVSITAMGAKRMNVTWWGKVGTFANMAAFPWFLFAAETSFSEAWRTFWKVAAYCAAIPGVIFSMLAAWQYIGLGRRALAEGRAEHAAARA